MDAQLVTQTADAFLSSVRPLRPAAHRGVAAPRMVLDDVPSVMVAALELGQNQNPTVFDPTTGKPLQHQFDPMTGQPLVTTTPFDAVPAAGRPPSSRSGNRRRPDSAAARAAGPGYRPNSSASEKAEEARAAAPPPAAELPAAAQAAGNTLSELERRLQEFETQVVELPGDGSPPRRHGTGGVLPALPR